MVQWNRAYNDTPTLSDFVTFQAVLYESGDILFHYPDVDDAGGALGQRRERHGGHPQRRRDRERRVPAVVLRPPVITDGQTILFTVPEPATASLLLAALAVLAGGRRGARWN